MTTTLYLLFLRVLALVCIPLTVLGFVGTFVYQRVWLGTRFYQEWAESVDVLVNEEDDNCGC